MSTHKAHPEDHAQPEGPRREHPMAADIAELDALIARLRQAVLNRDKHEAKRLQEKSEELAQAFLQRQLRLGSLGRLTTAEDVEANACYDGRWRAAYGMAALLTSDSVMGG